MLDTPDAVLDALRQADELPYGRRRSVLVEEAVEAAEQFEDRAPLVTALLELMEAYAYSAEDRKTPVVFARIMRLWDSKPDDFSEWEARQVYWRFKWVTNSLLQVPDVPLAAVVKWADEMQRRYRDAGHGLQPVYATRYAIAAHTGTGREQAYDLWGTRARTEFSDCEACETRHHARHRLALGDDERALTVWEPVLASRQTCSEEPYLSMAHALLPLLRTGRGDEARSHHLTGYRFARGKPDMVEALGLHLEFCALSRNEGRGLEILAENRDAFALTGSPLDLLEFLTGAEILLARLSADGHGELAVAGPPGRNWTVRTLLDQVRADAAGLAAAFDARNGTAAVGERRLTRLAQQPLVDSTLTLGIRVVPPAGTPQAAPRPRTAAQPEPVPADFAALVLRARELTDIGRPDADDLWERVRTAVAGEGRVHDTAALGPEPRLHAELAERAAFAALDAEEWDTARDAMLAAAGLYEQAELPGHAVAARARAATALVAANEHDPAVDCATARPDLDAALRRARELLAAEPSGIQADRYLAVLQCEAMVARHELAVEPPDASPRAREAFETAVAALGDEAARLGSPARQAAALQYAADAQARTGGFDAATEGLERAVALLEAAEQPWRLPRPLMLLAQVKMAGGAPAEAVPLVHRALADLARWPDPSLSLGSVHAALGHASAHAGDPSGAVRYLSEAADRFDREGSGESAAQVRLELADLLTEQGRQADAVAVLESLLTGESPLAGDPDGLDPRMHAQIRLNLARGLTALGELRAAAEEFVRLADTVAQWPDDRSTLTLVAAESAVALAKAGLWEAAHTAYRRAVDAHTEAPRPAPVAFMMREFARLTMADREAEGIDSALEHLARADALCAEVPDDAEGFVAWFHLGAIHYQRSRAYATAERPKEALAEMERAIAVYDGAGHPAEEPRAEAVRVAALIEGNALGDREAATARLTAAIARCEAAGLPEAASALDSVRNGLATR